MESNHTRRNLIAFDSLPIDFVSNKYRNHKFLLNSRDRSFVNKLVETDFSKKFGFRRDNYEFPNIENVYKEEKWKVDELQKFKEELNEVKSKLNNYNLEDWHKHTRLTNHAGNIIAALKKFEPEFLTQAWCKFYELVNRFRLVPKAVINDKIFNSVHLCEAPGAFIASLNHFLKINHPDVKWTWLGTTLNPYYEGNNLHDMINDDRFIINALEKWWFGIDDTGDLNGKDYLENLIKEAEKLGPIHLITADGSVDCQQNPSEQERHVSHLHFVETLCALNILEQGGSFLLKIFTIFECETICLMYLLRFAFKYVNVCKPVTSKEGNSEMYVACLEYKGKDYISTVLSKLNKYYYTTNDKALFSKSDIPADFLDQIIECAHKFQQFQISVIERNISTFDKILSKKKRFYIRNIREAVAHTFLNKYQLRPINPNDYIINNKSLFKVSYQLFPRDESGSFVERQSFKSFGLHRLLLTYKEKLSQCNYEWKFLDVAWLLPLKMETAEGVFEFPKVSLKVGKPINEIKVSKFSKGNLLNIFTELEKLFLSIKGDRVKRLEISLDKLLQDNIENYEKGIKFVDVNDAPWLVNCSESQIIFINNLKEVINELKVNETLVIKGLPLVTRFNVGLLYILGHYFEKVGLVNPSHANFCLIFNGLRDLKLQSEIEFIADSVIDNKGSVLSIVPITFLCENKFLRLISMFNEVTLFFSSNKMLDTLLKNHSEPPADIDGNDYK